MNNNQITTEQILSILDISLYTFKILAKKANLEPQLEGKRGLFTYKKNIWDRNIIPILQQIIKERAEHICPICGKKFFTSNLKRKYCGSRECHLESMKYKNKTPEGKKKVYLSGVKWNNLHKDKIKQYQIKYRKKKNGKNKENN